MNNMSINDVIKIIIKTDNNLYFTYYEHKYKIFIIEFYFYDFNMLINII